MGLPLRAGLLLSSPSSGKSTLTLRCKAGAQDEKSSTSFAIKTLCDLGKSFFPPRYFPHL